MPNIGDTARGYDIGLNNRSVYVWSACTKCGSQRYVRQHYHSDMCHKCGMAESIPCREYHKSRNLPRGHEHDGTFIGEVVKARDLGRKGGYRFRWSACADCGKLSWVALRQGKPITYKCLSCALKGHTISDTGKQRIREAQKLLDRRGPKSNSWRGGRRKNKQGYIDIWVGKGHPFSTMARKDGTILEHRLVFASAIGRVLFSWEVIHHINGIKDDNRIENLELLPSNSKHNTRMHSTLKKMQKQLSEVQDRVALLEAENARLNALLSGVQDSDTPKNMNLHRYNTPAVQGDLPESIVRAFSNEGDNEPKSV